MNKKIEIKSITNQYIQFSRSLLATIYVATIAPHVVSPSMKGKIALVYFSNKNPEIKVIVIIKMIVLRCVFLSHTLTINLDFLSTPPLHCWSPYKAIMI